ncbi:MAG TPA: RNA methyltransferase [Bacteroidales bacterium]|nr:RNA methyltransferase [Bacteroidales bacterium]HQL46421.1 RNA methyltransferase [Bacteroidales bacterium]
MHRKITRNHVKLILSLQKRKVREDKSLFVIEGDKLVREYILAGNRVMLMAGKPEWIDSESEAVIGGADEVVMVSYEELRRISSLRTPHNVLAVAPMRKVQYSDDSLRGRLTPVLECVQDPGNLGTIMRIAAWFGMTNIVCSPDSVDSYNPKVIQATMGAFMHVNVRYRPLDELLGYAAGEGIPVYGTTTDGTSVYDSELGREGIILFGNESKGISAGLLKHVTSCITIPGPPNPAAGLESLNVSMAAAIICSEFARRGRSIQNGKRETISGI